jgi:hypothetical protein
MRVLFIGDSFTADIDDPFVGFATAADPASMAEATEVSNPGTVLAGMWFCCQSVQTIQEGDWSVVVLQEDLSIDGAGPPAFFEYTRSFNEEIEAVGAQTVLYMPWEYRRDNPVTLADIADAYGTIAAELGIKVAPVGLAWDRALSERPDYEIYADDGAHANVRGSYLTIAVLYATIFEKSPEEVPWFRAQMAADGFEVDADELSDEDITFLRRIAWEAVVDYQEGG